MSWSLYWPRNKPKDHSIGRRGRYKLIYTTTTNLLVSLAYMVRQTRRLHWLTYKVFVPQLHDSCCYYIANMGTNLHKLLQCVCDICENVELLLICIAASMSKSGIELPSCLKRHDNRTHRHCLDMGISTLCHPSLYSPNCLARDCGDCGTGNIRQVLSQWAELDDTHVSYFRWGIQDRIVKLKTIKHLTKIAHSGTKRDVLNELLTQLIPYGQHSFLQSSQTRSFGDCVKHTSVHTAVAVIDFAENYTCLRQDEA